MESLDEDIQNLFNDDDDMVNVNHKANVASTVEVAKGGSKRSKAWDQYLIIDSTSFTDGFKRAQCKHCKIATYIAETRFGTTNLNKHLEKCPQYQEWKASQDSQGTEETRFDQKTYRDLLTKAIIRHGYSFSWVEHEENREIHTYLNNQVKTICRNTAKSDVLKMHALLKTKLKDTLLTLPGRICLTCDLWTSCQTEGYLCLTAHYVDSNWKLNSRVLNFRHLEPPHTGSMLCGIVFDLLQEWGIQHKIFSITLDNASSNDKMQDGLKAKLIENGLLLSFGDYFHIRCAAHTLNLIVKDGLKTIDDCVVKVRESVKYVKGSEGRKLLFQHCVKRAMLREKKALWLDVPTRWNSTYFMLDRALIYRHAFKELYQTDPFYKNFPSEHEWERIMRIYELLGPFSEITKMFSGSDYPTANLYFENVWKIDMFLKEQSQSDDQVIRDMALEMRTKFDKYWSEYTLLFAFATVLDPRCKLVFLRYCYKKLYGDEERASFKVSQVHFKLETLLKEYTKAAPQSVLPTPSSSNTIDEGLGSHKRKFDYSAEFDENDHNSSCTGKTKLDLYLEDEKLESKTQLDVLSFWKLKQERYGELALLAKDILSVPLTTVASESTFSIGGRILNKWKSSYIPESVEALVATRSWLYGFESDGEEEFIGSFVDWTSAKPSSLDRFTSSLD